LKSLQKIGLEEIKGWATYSLMEYYTEQ
jgi:hypothetical protein